MSQENVEIVRRPLRPAKPRAHRRLEERLSLRFPRARVFIAAAVWRLPPSSRLRQMGIRHFAQTSLDAYHRGDFEATYALWHPDSEMAPPPELATLGLEAVARGHQARIEFQRRWVAEWGELRFHPEEIVDLGNRLMVVGRIKGRGLSSGAPIDSEWAALLSLDAGAVVHEQVFFDHEKAFAAVGLSE